MRQRNTHVDPRQVYDVLAPGGSGDPALPHRLRGRRGHGHDRRCRHGPRRAVDNAVVLTVPVNHWMIGRGRGHAAVHHHGRCGG